MSHPRIILPPSVHRPPGLILIACSELLRYANFAASVARTSGSLDDGSAVMWSFGSSVADNCNGGVQALLQAPGMDWIWILGDDHEWDDGLLPTLVDRMYEHNLDILVPLCFRRSWPPAFVIYDHEVGGVLRLIDADKVAEIVRSGDTLREVLAAGTAGMLIRRRVLVKLEAPHFRNVLQGPKGVISQAGEDLNFCHAAREAGFRVHADFSLVLGHLRAVTLVPEMTKDGLGMRIHFGGPQGPVYPLTE